MTKAKKIVYRSDPNLRPECIFGLIIKEDDNFITVKTNVREIEISKSAIVSISTTNSEYFEGTR